MKRTLFTFFLFTISINLLFSIDPVREYKLRPESYKIDYTEQRINTKDGHVINTWHMKPSFERRQNKLFVLVGSDSGNMGFMLSHAVYLLKEGYSVVTFDYRGFGASSDFAYQADCLYHPEYVIDFTTVLEWIKKEIQPDKVGVLSFSMGTLISVLGFEHNNYDFYVAEGFILSPDSLVSRAYKLKQKVIHLPETAVDYSKKLLNLKTPGLLFSSNTDQYTTLRDCQIFARARSNISVVPYDGEHLRGASSIGYKKYVDFIAEVF